MTHLPWHSTSSGTHQGGQSTVQHLVRYTAEQSSVVERPPSSQVPLEGTVHCSEDHEPPIVSKPPTPLRAKESTNQVWSKTKGNISHQFQELA